MGSHPIEAAILELRPIWVAPLAIVSAQELLPEAKRHFGKDSLAIEV